MKDKDIEDAAIQSAQNFGAPDVSGGVRIDDHLGLVYFKDKDGHTSLVMNFDDYKEFIASCRLLKRLDKDDN